MNVLNLRTVYGPNVYHTLPVVIMTVDLGEWHNRASNEIEGFTDKLIQILPGLIEHHCSIGERGGFIQRLRKGTYMAHVIEHVALELSTVTQIEATFGKTRNIGQPARYEIVTRYTNEEGMKECLRAAFRLVSSLLLGAPFDFLEAVSQIQQKIPESILGPSSEALLRAARRQDIPYRHIGKDSLLELGYGKNIRRIQTAVTDQTSLVAADLVQDKYLTKIFLADAFIPVPYGKILQDLEELDEAIQEMQPPYVIKPLDGNHGNGVSLNLKSKEALQSAFHLARSFCSQVLLEEMVQGKDYRILVIDGKLVAASERKPPSIIGDGVKSVRTLIEELNSDPRRGEGHSNCLSKISIDEVLLENLKKQNLDLNSVILSGQEVILRENANLSSGGTARDVTDEVHKDVRILCERVARLTGLDICGIDLIHSDISKAPGSALKVIEVNAGPGLRMHLYPSEGKPRRVADDIIRMLYPTPESSCIPITAVTGTNGKTTVVRMLSHILSYQKDCVGMTSTDGIWIGNEKIVSGDSSGPASARTVLSDPKVETAVLEVARGGILRGGLGYDWSDVGIVTNIRADHIGQDGIEYIDDLVWIKSLVAERVRENGTLVLNADDEESAYLAESPRVISIPRRILFYSTSATNSILARHLHKGGDACWVEKDWIYCHFDGRVSQLGRVQDIPVTLRGLAQFQVSNILAAVGGALGLGVEAKNIFPALQSFSALMNNVGRMNIYKVYGSYVLLDYGHNPDAIHAIGELLDNFDFSRRTLLFGLPGDRDTELIQEAGLAAAENFDRLIVRDDLDLRGRSAMEVPLILKNICGEKMPHVDCKITKNEEASLTELLRELQDQEVIVVLFERLGPIMDVLRQFDPVPMEAFDLVPRAFSEAETKELARRESMSRERDLRR